MTLLQALLLGVLQGATEFLPISSSGHLALAHQLAPATTTPFLLFEVVVHMGTLCAIAWMLRARIASLLRALPSLLSRAPEADTPERRWILLILAASVPTAIIGFALRGPVEGFVERPALVGGALCVTAVLLFFSERIGRRSRDGASLSLTDALLVGIAQGLAVIPGISRSGATVATALWRDVRGDVAVDFSLLVSVPAVVGATALVALESAGRTSSADAAPLVVGFAAAFVTGAAALKALRWIVAQRKLMPFAAYCAVVGIGAVVLG